MIVSNEYEALLLEDTLVKQHSPRYNIDLKDGKTYPMVKVTAGAFPRVFKTRYITHDDGSRYFGPFASVQAIEALIKIIEKLFPLRKCKKLRTGKAPCMYYHIGRCAAPCAGKISAEDYGVHVENAVRLLGGRTEELLASLTVQMKAAAERLDFEAAAKLRDTIGAVRIVSEKSSVVDFDEDSRDYIAFANSGLLCTFSVFSMRGGRLTGRALFRAKSAAEDIESCFTFITSYYNAERPPPANIFVNIAALENFPDELKKYFSDKFGTTPELRSASEKRHAVVLALAKQNADEDLRKRLKECGADAALDELQAALKLRCKPYRIEGFDIAQLDGKHPVASLISFKNGVPDKKNYRLFKLRSVVGIVDDFQAMR